MSRNVFDDPEFFEGYHALRSDPRNYNALLEQPAMRALLPDIQGLEVLDLGCGAGENCLEFARGGAKRVLGLDRSQKMLAVAREATDAEGVVEYRLMDLEALRTLEDGPFDLVYSALAMHYVEDFEALAGAVFGLLRPGGIFLFSQEHPLTTATRDGDFTWNRDKDGRAISFTISNYSQSGRRSTRWFVDGVEKYHRTVGEIVTAVAAAGFVIRCRRRRLSRLCRASKKNF